MYVCMYVCMDVYVNYDVRMYRVKRNTTLTHTCIYA